MTTQTEIDLTSKPKTRVSLSSDHRLLLRALLRQWIRDGKRLLPDAIMADIINANGLLPFAVTPGHVTTQRRIADLPVPRGQLDADDIALLQQYGHPLAGGAAGPNAELAQQNATLREQVTTLKTEADQLRADLKRAYRLLRDIESNTRRSIDNQVTVANCIVAMLPAVDE